MNLVGLFTTYYWGLFFLVSEKSDIPENVFTGDPDVISKVQGREDVNYLDGWANTENLQLLNLM